MTADEPVEGLEDFTWTINLPVSSGRPYVTDEWRRYVVLAPDAIAASLVACQMALCTSMPMSKGQIESCVF